MLEIGMAITKMMLLGTLTGLIGTITMILGVNAIRKWKGKGERLKHFNWDVDTYMRFNKWKC